MLGFKGVNEVVEEIRQLNRKVETLQKITVQQYKVLGQIKYCLKDHHKVLEMLLQEQFKENKAVHKALSEQLSKISSLLDPEYYALRQPKVKLTFGEKDDDLVQ